MRYEKIELEGYGEKFFIEAYIAERVGDFVRSAMLVIPGGGYGCVCSDREGEPIAHAFMPYGYNSFVLHYTVGKKPFPCQLVQASVAMKYIRDHADELCIDPARVFVSGYSAGGHLAASLGTMWHKDFITKEADIEYGINAPTGMMLIYPVISAEHHKFSFNNLLLNDAPTEEELKVCSVENSVDDKTCPAFILHTSNDEVVDVRNSLSFANALANNDIRFEMHIYPDAPHGIALANEITACGNEKWCNTAIAEWVRHAAVWAKSI